jgi:hypothetical protein
MPRFLIDQPMPFDTTDRLEDFLQKAASSPFSDDPVVQAAIGRVQGYLLERQTPNDQPRHEPVASPG